MRDRKTLVSAAHRSIVLGSRSFALASRLFDRVTRERVWLLYAWCRAADDIADGQQHGMGQAPVADPHVALALIRTQTERALAGLSTGDPAFDALGVVVQECAIPRHLPADVIEGFALDADGFSPPDEAALLHYCYCVAGAVGVMMANVMGLAPDDDPTLDRACDLGIAFQLANIARDIEEDAAAGRCYIPMTWLAEFGIDRRNIGRPETRSALTAVTGRLARMAAAYEQSAKVGAASLNWRARWAVLAAAGIYSGIAYQVAAAGEHGLGDRVTTSASKKMWEVFAALISSTRRPKAIARGGLWSRPRLPLPSDAFAAQPLADQVQLIEAGVLEGHRSTAA